MSRTSYWGRYHARTLVSVVDEMWRDAAFHRWIAEPRIQIWESANQRLLSRVKQASPGYIRHHAPPPRGLVRCLLGAGWWDDVDARVQHVTRAPQERDPLYRYGRNLRHGWRRDLLLKEVASQREDVLLHDVIEPLMEAVASGSIIIEAYDGLESVEFPAKLLAQRDWVLSRDGYLYIPRADGQRLAYRSATLLVPAMSSTLPPPSVDVAAPTSGCSNAPAVLVSHERPAPAEEPAQVVQPHRTGMAGRPTSRHLIENELKRRAQNGEMLQTLIGEATYLCTWLHQNHREAPPIKPEATTNTIRKLYRELKKTH